MTVGVEARLDGILNEVKGICKTKVVDCMISEFEDEAEKGDGIKAGFFIIGEIKFVRPLINWILHCVRVLKRATTKGWESS